MRDPQPLSRPRRPLLGLLLVFVLGLLLPWLVELHALVYVCAAVVLLIAAQFTIHASAMIMAALLVLGAAHAEMTLRSPSPRFLDRVVPEERIFAALDLQVADEPVALTGDGGELRGWSAPCRVRGVQRRMDWQRADGELLAIWPATGIAPPAFGSVLHASGLLIRNDQGKGPARWRFRIHHDERDVTANLSGVSLKAWCLKGRRFCSDILGLGLGDFPEQAGLLRALMLGYRGELSDRLSDVFSRTGTLHVVAISGSHVVVIATLVIALLRAMGLSRTRWVLFVGPFLILYTLGTGMSSSAVRACLMAVVFWSATLIRRKPDGPTALAVSALILLVVDPLQMMDTGFLLSFVAVAGLMTVHPVLVESWKVRGQDEAWAEQPLAGERTWHKQLLEHGVLLAAASVAAWVTTAPITAHQFNLISPVGLLLNMLVIPISAVILLTGCLSLAVGWISPLGAEIFNHANRFFVDLMFGSVWAFDRIPAGHLFVQSPPLWLILSWYIAVVLLCYGSRLAKACALGAAGLVMVVALVMHVRDDDVTLHVRLVGGQPVVLANVPGNNDVLIGGADRFRSRQLEQSLRGQGVDHLSVWLIPRMLANVAGAADSVLQRVGASSVWFSKATPRTDSFRRLEAMDVERVGVASGDSGNWGGGVVWDVFAPPGERREKAGSDAALVLRVARGAGAVLLAGHFGSAQEDHLMQLRRDWGAPVLLLRSLDEETPPSLEFLEASLCEVVILPPLEGIKPSLRDAWLRRCGEGGRRVIELSAGDILDLRFPGLRPDRQRDRMRIALNGEEASLR